MSADNPNDGLEIGPTIEPLDAGVAARFEDIGELGRGGMGDVHRMRERGLNRVVALKVIQGWAYILPTIVFRKI